MSARLLLVSLTLASLFAGGLPTAAAKPPDLPLDESITCAAGAEGPSGLPCPFGSDAQPGPTPGTTCPYLKQCQATEKNTPAPQVESLTNSVLDNLDKLEKAQKLYRKAEHFQQTGQVHKAALLFEKVHELVPGSSYDEMASAQMAQMQAEAGDRARELTGEGPAEAAEPEVAPPEQPVDMPRMEAHARVTQLLKRCAEAFQEGDYETAERLVLKAALRMQRLRQQMYTLSPTVPLYEPPAEQETVCTPQEEPTGQSCAPVQGDAEEAADLLEKCQRAIMAGCYDEAEDLARKALALDPTSVDANGMLYELQISRLGRNASPPGTSEEATRPDAPDEEVLPPPMVEEPFEEEARSSSGVLPQMEPPAVDPKIVDALEKVLAQQSEPGTPKLVIVEIDDPADATEEQEEEPVSEWPYVPADVEMPSLFVPLPQDLTIEDEDAPQDEEEADDDDLSPPRDLNGLLRNVLEAIQQGACVEVDAVQPGSLRVRCEFQVGGVECRVLCDLAGHDYVICTPVPEANGDLRAAQLAHNQQIMNWIESISSDGGASLDDDEVGESADPIDDDMDDDEVTP